MTIVPHDDLELIKRIRGNAYLQVRVKSIIVFDDLESEISKIQLYLHEDATIEASGVGMVDAIFSGLKNHYHKQFESLKHLELTNFFVKIKSKGTKSEVEVSLEVKNSYGKILTFVDNSKSLTASATRVAVAVVEYFCNSEAAFFSVLSALNSAKDRGREDLVTRYTEELSRLVKNTCYYELRNETGGSKK